MNLALRGLGRPAAGLLLVPAVALAAACSPSPSSSPASGSPVSGSPAISSSPAGSPSSTTQSAAQGPQPCPTHSLRIAAGSSQGAAGSTYLDIVFTNGSATTCSLYGYPGVSLVGGSPLAQIGPPAKENPQTPRHLVTLSPGGHASALLRIVDALNFPKSRCGPEQASYLRVYPPNQTTPAYIAYKATACRKPVRLLTIDVVKPGPGG